MEIEYGDVTVSGYVPLEKGNPMQWVIDGLNGVLFSRDGYNTGGRGMARVIVTIHVDTED